MGIELCFLNNAFHHSEFFSSFIVHVPSQQADIPQDLNFCHQDYLPNHEYFGTEERHIWAVMYQVELKHGESQIVKIHSFVSTQFTDLITNLHIRLKNIVHFDLFDLFILVTLALDFLAL